MKQTILPLHELTEDGRDKAAAILMRALAHVPSAWHDHASARQEVDSFFGNPERLGFSLLEDATMLGWIGAIRHYPQAWELHPIVVAPERQQQGIGSRLLSALERQAASEGAGALWLGTDDDFGGTTLFGKDLYPDVLGALATLAPAAGHPYTFYRARGFVVTGVIPDANGLGKHDILMAKRISAAGQRPA